MTQKLVKMWVTKYALTQGIYEAKGKLVGHQKDTFMTKTSYGKEYLRAGEYWRLKEQAIEQATTSRVLRMCALRKEIDSLKKLRFE